MFGVSVSPCSQPELSLEEFCSGAAEMGYHRIEVFTNWTGSIFDYTQSADFYTAQLEEAGLSLSSLHLPAFGPDLEESLSAVKSCLEFTAGLGCPIAILHGKNRELIIKGARRLLEDGYPDIQLVITNHAGTAVASIADFKEVLDGINDKRIMGLLEVGHFHTEGVSWQEGYDLLKGNIALVHIKDQIGSQSVAFGTGEIDLPGLFERLNQDGYTGDVVVEMEVTDKENTARYLKEALDYIKQYKD